MVQLDQLVLQASTVPQAVRDPLEPRAQPEQRLARVQPDRLEQRVLRVPLRPDLRAYKESPDRQDSPVLSAQPEPRVTRERRLLVPQVPQVLRVTWV